MSINLPAMHLRTLLEAGSPDDARNPFWAAASAIDRDFRPQTLATCAQLLPVQVNSMHFRVSSFRFINNVQHYLPGTTPQ
jgi:hypothetical protein